MDKIDAQYEQVDFNALLDLCIAFIKVQEKIYGPVYSRMAKKYAMEFVAKKLGEKPPRGSEDWDWSQVKEYLKKPVRGIPTFLTLSRTLWPRHKLLCGVQLELVEIQQLR